jgi:hypothetical protein
MFCIQEASTKTIEDYAQHTHNNDQTMNVKEAKLAFIRQYSYLKLLGIDKCIYGSSDKLH